MWLVNAAQVVMLSQRWLGLRSGQTNREQ